MRNFRDGMRRQIRRAGAGLRGAWTRLRRFIRRHGGRIAYYACVALVLSAIAYAAEQYRSEPVSYTHLDVYKRQALLPVQKSKSERRISPSANWARRPSGRAHSVT